MNVYTRSEYRRQGIARKMVELLVEEAWKKGATESMSKARRRAHKPWWSRQCSLQSSPYIGGVMQIRKCKTVDIPLTGAFYDKVVEYLDDHINYPRWKYKEYPSEQYARAMTEEGFQYICIENGKIFAAFVLNSDPEGDYQKGNWSRMLSDGEYMVIHALAVDPDRSGKGLGKEIVRFCIDTAKKSGFKAIRLDIVPTNTPAQKLYEYFGFNYAGEENIRPDIEDIPSFRLYELNFDE